MNDLKFDKKHFFRTIFIFLILSFGWTALCIQTNEFTDRDKGLITGVGFLLLLAVSIYVGQSRKPLNSLFLLAIITITIFLIASFVLAPLIVFTTNSTMLYVIVNSFFVSIAMTAILNRTYGIRLRYFTIALSFSMLVVAYFIFANFDKDDYLYLKYGLHPRLAMFNIFQFMLILPLALGINVKKVSAELSIPQS